MSGNDLLNLSRTGNLSALKQLLEPSTTSAAPSALDLEAKDIGGRTGLVLAAAKGHAEVVSLLIRVGADSEATDQCGWTALHLSARHNQLECIKVLIADGSANVHKVNHYGGRNALMRAALRDNLDACLLLIKSGANLFARDSRGETALDMYGRELESEVLPFDDAVEVSGHGEFGFVTPAALSPGRLEARRAALRTAYSQFLQQQQRATQETTCLSSNVVAPEP